MGRINHSLSKTERVKGKKNAKKTPSVTKKNTVVKRPQSRAKASASIVRSSKQTPSKNNGKQRRRRKKESSIVSVDEITKEPSDDTRCVILKTIKEHLFKNRIGMTNKTRNRIRKNRLNARRLTAHTDKSTGGSNSPFLSSSSSFSSSSSSSNEEEDFIDDRSKTTVFENADFCTLVNYDPDHKGFEKIVNPLNGRGGEGLRLRYGMTRIGGDAVKSKLEEISKSFILESVLRCVELRKVGNKVIIDEDVVALLGNFYGFTAVF
jgi:hypothetical protein